MTADDFRRLALSMQGAISRRAFGRAWASAHKPAGFRVFFCEDRPQTTCGWLR
jgi:hypothetical protein